MLTLDIELPANDFESYFDPKSLVNLYLQKVRKSSAVGKDGVRKEKFASILHLEAELIAKKCLEETYGFTCYKQKLIAKGADQFPRLISIPTIRDRLTLRALNEYLVANNDDAKPSLPHRYIREITSTLDKGLIDHSFIRIDVKNFFPSIDHELLLQKLDKRKIDPKAISLVRKAIQNPTGASKTQIESTQGIPQGLSISTMLSSIFLNELDVKYTKKYAYWRYVDDILVVCPSHKSSRIFKELAEDLRSIGLEEHPLKDGSKSDIRPLKKAIDYLGYTLSPGQTKVRKSSYNRMFENLMKVFTSFKYTRKSEKFIFRLNLKIAGCIFEGKRKGWLFFFSQTNDLNQLGRLDYFVQSMCREYAPEIDPKRIKKFVRAWHEIRQNFKKTNYFQKFDDYDYSDKIDFVSLMTGRHKSDLEILDLEDFEVLYRRVLDKEIEVLEQDILDSFS
ncbi:reverse transcriptase domain-containing protein [Parasphingorhabdus sp.]|uniref:reverse transcriptase domain-containing protein n=1 Tax=Parasphingorhabdus sp. TaxID=2709688 RepID=UPI003266E334